ncbi:MAG: Peptide chain release factor 2 [Candidatus Uhrbacteria bacterium GW2011_GWC2_53_7]|uniref:Peptide chain release factor 2 n=1 Tax=Candidatus Uhrbacteria bacterium GW2011_GWC2_53_7 TaxID=1618986 RepID=A0A0G2AUL7_9BACT|nr:MAG: Peptide chain release factor 2 [Candidatus Uhrbacteria bacterium GW2011_GWC2_53_7]
MGDAVFGEIRFADQTLICPNFSTTFPSNRTVPPAFGGYFDLSASKEKVTGLELKMAEPGFWNDQETARRVSQEAAGLKGEVEEMESAQKKLQELGDYVKLAEEEGELSAFTEASADMEELTHKLDAIEMRTLLGGEHDKRNATLEIHAGSGGTEANDWSAMLLRMYLRFCERQKWKVTLLSESRGDETGYKSVSLRVEGRYAYGHLKSEAGVHRLVRISPFDAEKMRHTTFALVDVVPEFDDVEVDLDMADVRVETSTSQGAGGQSVNTTYSAIRLVHEPTGIVATCQNERSQQQNKETALRILKSRLYQLELERQEKKIKSIRGDMASAEWGNQIRSYVLHPYKMVKDHRTLEETQDAQEVLDGNLDRFVDAYLRMEVRSS